jgi:hypothetical protein
MIVPVDIVAVQVNQNNSLFVTTGVDYDNNGAVVGSEITSQYTLNPGDSLEGQPTEVVNIANALWTPEVVEAYKLANPVIAPPQPKMIVPPMLPQVEPVLVTQADSEPSSAQEIVAPVQDVTDAPAA